MHQRGARRAGQSGNAKNRNETQTKNSEVNEAGRAKKLGRITVDFVSTLFEIEKNMKRYVGGLVYFDGSTSVYRASRGNPMI